MSLLRACEDLDLDVRFFSAIFSRILNRFLMYDSGRGRSKLCVATLGKTDNSGSVPRASRSASSFPFMP